MNSLGNILYYCTLLHIICEHLHDLYTLHSLLGRKGLKKFIPRDSLISPLIYILFSMVAQYAIAQGCGAEYRTTMSHTKCPSEPPDS